MSDTRRRVKVYTLNEDRQWDDRGTGHVSSTFVERLKGISLLVRAESDGEFPTTPPPPGGSSIAPLAFDVISRVGILESPLSNIIIITFFLITLGFFTRCFIQLPIFNLV